MKSLVSIIIPTYNRAHLICETLDSIIAQIYTNWECIIVDDGSTDNTKELIVGYSEKDKRIQYHQRPVNRPKGANACRNYGFELSKGEYINWFDSDDIMLSEHLEKLVITLQMESVDFVVGDCVNFEVGKVIDEKPYSFDKTKVKMDPVMYAKNQIGWITDDFLGKREIIQNIRFNEKLDAGQEYNFFVRLLLQNKNGIFINEILTHRRVHEGSVSVKNKENENNYFSVIATIKYQTAQDLVVYNNIDLIRWFLSGYMRYSFMLANENNAVPYKNAAFRLICNYYSYKNGIAFILALVFARYFNKGYNIMKYARR